MQSDINKSWLKVTAVIIGGFGPIFFLGTMEATSEPARWSLDLLSWPVDGVQTLAAPTTSPGLFWTAWVQSRQAITQTFCLISWCCWSALALSGGRRHCQPLESLSFADLFFELSARAAELLRHIFPLR